MELAVTGSDAVESARRTLGLKLAICRRAGGYAQADFASLIDYSRSTVANVETGRQHVPRTFWVAADAALRTGGALTGVNDEIEAAVRRERQVAARWVTPFPLSLAASNGSVGSLVRVPDGALAVAGHGDDWLDVISLAAAEAREHAEKTAITDIGPAAVEQFTADVVRVAVRCNAPVTRPDSGGDRAQDLSGSSAGSEFPRRGAVRPDGEREPGPGPPRSC